MKQSETWYTKTLGDAIYDADQLLDEILPPYFQAVYTREGEPAAMAVFTRLESEGRLHCECVVYFSPAAGEVARAFGAGPCEKPARAGLKLVAGNERAWSALFAEAGG